MARPTTSKYDVIVVGAGNAALTAALSACEAGASKVLVLEKASYALRGGNSRFTGGIFRFTYSGLPDIKELIPTLTPAELAAMEVGTYDHDDYYKAIMRVTEGLADPELTRVVIEESASTARWMAHLGVEWDLTFLFARTVGGVRYFNPGTVIEAKGRGPGLVVALFKAAEKKEAIEIRYETKMTRLLMDSRGVVYGVTIKNREGFHDIHSKAVILACGGFEANTEMRVKYLGPEWNTVKVRGTRYDTGDGLRAALEMGAQPFGQWSGCHATPIEANAPPVGDVEIFDRTNRVAYMYSIMLNARGERFVDEGEDLGSYTYAKTGRAILGQPRGIAFQVFDAKTHDLREERYSVLSTPASANTLDELAEKLAIDSDVLVSTVRRFNEGVRGGEFNPGLKDGKGTRGVVPPKSNWALPLDTPPFVAYPVCCGITFTFGGLKVNTRAQMLDTEDNVIPGLYATGEITGGFFYHNYTAGAGLMRGAVFGRLAGGNAVVDMR
ncbi:MAG: FAD-dependent tricarballylate dehydrogenase TcuA [Chloroflexi bacterium]|nr:FAD-dependent tricarballylate dehydrogenase TcuA [Chloroflexota bacterium]